MKNKKCRFCGAKGKDGLYDCWTPMNPLDDSFKIKRTRLCFLREAVQKYLEAIESDDSKKILKWFMKMEKLSGKYTQVKSKKEPVVPGIDITLGVRKLVHVYSEDFDRLMNGQTVSLMVNATGYRRGEEIYVEDCRNKKRSVICMVSKVTIPRVLLGGISHRGVCEIQFSPNQVQTK
jgi:hypothetical protein